MSFEQYVLERFGRSIHQIELEIALHEYLAGGTPQEAWDSAHLFSEAMKEVWQSKA